MNPSPSRLADYLGYIALAIARIQRHTVAMDETAFKASEMAQDAVIRNLEIIGEASRNIEREHPDFAVAHPGLPLSAAYEMRNMLAHGYFKVDLGIVWRTVQHDLAPIADQVLALKQAFDDPAAKPVLD